MGNTPSRESLALESNPNLSYNIKLGTFACIRVDKRTMDTNEFGEAVEKQSMSYEVHDRACNLTLTKTRPLPAAAAGNGNNRGQKFIISISEMGYSVRIEVQIAEVGHVVVTCARASFRVESSSSILGLLNPFSGKTQVVDLTSKDNLITCTTKDGGITESCIHRYQGSYRYNAQGLIVLQLKKKGRDQSAYLVTVAHYFVHLGRRDTGLSLVARIRGDKGLQLEGPIQHPGTALHQLLEQTKRSSRWARKACPHCANLYDQRQSSQQKIIDQRQSESESDNEEDSNRAAATIVRQNESVLSNNGVTIGNDNGSMHFSAQKMVIYRGGKHVGKKLI